MDDVKQKPTININGKKKVKGTLVYGDVVSDVEAEITEIEIAPNKTIIAPITGIAPTKEETDDTPEG